MGSVTQNPIPDKVAYISLRDYDLRKYMNLSPAMSKLEGRLSCLILFRLLAQEKEEYKFKQPQFYLKNDFVSHPAREKVAV